MQHRPRRLSGLVLISFALHFAAWVLASVIRTKLVPLPALLPESTSAGVTIIDIDVIVIGAGVAGLGAARALADAGRKVVVIEARNRTGGRLWTQTGSTSIPIELGAQVIAGRNASTWEIVRQQGLDAYAQRNIFSRMTVGGPWKRETISSPYNFQVIGGYNQILSPLTRDLSISLNTIVRRVEYTAGAVVVHAEKNGRELIYAARAVVLALPVAVLKANTIDFFPPLPIKKSRAFMSVPHIKVTKVIMEFDKVVFPQDADQVVEAGKPLFLLNAAMGIPRYSGRVIVAVAENDEAERL